jgi:hypothetical protein
VEATRARKAANEAVFRHVNEQIDDLRRRFAVLSDGLLHIVCECDRMDCAQPIDVEIPIYERVRADSACFFVAPGHEDPSIEAVVDSGRNYLVVRKRPGEAAQIAERTDPRRS